MWAELRAGAGARACGRAGGVGAAAGRDQACRPRTACSKNHLDPSRLKVDVVRGGGRARGRDRASGAAASPLNPFSIASTLSGSTSTPCAPVMTNSGGPPTAVATTERSDAIASSSRLPERLDQAWLADDVPPAWIQRSTCRGGTRPASVHAGSLPSSCGAERAVADEGQPPRVQVARTRRPAGRRSSALSSEPTHRYAGPSPSHPSVRARLGLVAAAEPLEVDAAVDDL